MTRYHLTAETLGRGSFLREGGSQLLPGAGAPWYPYFNVFPFLGKKGLFSCLLIHTIRHAPVECLPCARYCARCGRTAVSRQMSSLPFGLNGVVVWGKQWLCFLSLFPRSRSPPHSPSPSSLSFLPIICPPHTPNPRGLHPRKSDAYPRA